MHFLVSVIMNYVETEFIKVHIFRKRSIQMQCGIVEKALDGVTNSLASYGFFICDAGISDSLTILCKSEVNWLINGKVSIFRPFIILWKWKSLSHVQLFAIPCTIQSMEFSRSEYWSGYQYPLLQGIFPTQGSNPGLSHCREILYQLSHQGSPRILKWVAYPFSRGSPLLRIKLGSPSLQADSLPAKLPEKPYILL